MEPIKDLLPRALQQPMQSLSRLSSDTPKLNEDHFEVSLYSGSPASDTTKAWSLKVMQGCFPQTTKTVFEVIVDRLTANGWSDQKVIDAVNKLVETHKYPTICPADLLGFDKKKILYSYNQMLDRASKYGSNVWDEVERVKINGKIFYEPKV